MTAAVSLLPLALLPQVLLSRVAAGDALRSWSTLSLYAPLAILPESVADRFHRSKAERGLSGTFARKTALAVVSLPMLTRPATASVDMARQSPLAGRREGWIAIELAYLFILVGAWCVAFYAVFRRLEKPSAAR